MAVGRDNVDISWWGCWSPGLTGREEVTTGWLDYFNFDHTDNECFLPTNSPPFQLIICGYGVITVQHLLAVAEWKESVMQESEATFVFIASDILTSLPVITDDYNLLKP